MLATVLCAQCPAILAFHILGFAGSLPCSNTNDRRLLLFSVYCVWEGYIVPATNFLLLELQAVSTRSRLRVIEASG